MLNWIKIIYLNISKVIKFKETGVRNEDIKIYIIRELKKLLYVMYIIREKWLNINKKVLENYVYKVWNINKKNKLNWYKNIGYNYNKNEEINKNMKSKLVSNLLESLLTGIIIKKDSLGINNGVNKKYRNKLKNIKVKKLSIFISKPVIRERIKEIEINFYYYLPSYRFRKFYKRIENGLELLRKRNTNYKIKWNLKKELNNLVDNNKWKKIRILKLIKKVSNRKNIKEIWIKDNKNYTNNYLTSNLMNNIMLDILNIKKMNKYLNGIFKTKRIINQINKNNK